MQVVTDAVYAARKPRGIGDYRQDKVSEEHWHLLGTISRGQRKRFRKLDIIPRQVLCVWWDNGYLPHRQRPDHGTDLMRLLEHLKGWAYRDEAHYQKGLWLFQRIVEEEIKPRPHRKKHR